MSAVKTLPNNVRGPTLAHVTGTSSESPPDPTPRPQSLMLTFFGIHVLDRDVAISSASVIDVFAGLGISEEAVRSTLTRMVGRGLLNRHKHGRKMYFSLTARAAAVLRDGRDRVWGRGAANRDWDGRWTLVGFSLPESWRSERHDLRSRLAWGGFGPLQNGLWIAPGEVDVATLVADLGFDDHLNVFRAEAVKPTEVRRIVGSAFDVAAIAAGYEAFLARWGVPGTGAGDPLAGQLLLHTDWLDLVRRDPHLPAEHLPAGWPAIRAEELFRRLAGEQDAAAAARAEEILDAVAVPAEQAPAQ
jgi:phenylacetic acid degradation operon negative regulatory protein